jgi:DNA-binding CsgD family transcriptional regulator
MSPRAVLGHVAKAGRRLQVDGHRQEAIVDHAYRHGDFDDLPDLAVRAAATPQSLRVPRCLRRTLACIARGLSTGATANELHVTRSTVREYKRRLQQTLGTEKQPRMVALGWQFRLLGPSTRPAINPE